MSDHSPSWLARLKDWQERVQAPWRSARTPLELRKALLEAVAERTVPVAPGQRIIDFNHVQVRLFFEDEQERWVLEQAAPTWRRDLDIVIAERLQVIGCTDITVAVEVEVADSPGLSPELTRYSIRFERSDHLPAASPILGAPTPSIELEIVKGTAEQNRYQFDQPLVLIGRDAEVLDQHGRLRRRNHVAFVDSDGIGRTVSREHARILWRDDPAGHWLVDDRSAHGTQLFRAGRAIPVTSRDRRGIRLESGDEIYFGQAMVRYRPGS